MIFYKGKGLLVPLFLIVSFVGSAVLSGVLSRNVPFLQGVEISFKYVLALALIIAGTWTWYTKDTYIVKDGKKIILEDEVNSFYFIKMNYWTKIFFLIAIFLIIDCLIFG